MLALRRFAAMKSPHALLMLTARLAYAFFA
jgi:hypothetical protein